jgi:hypothetical protein
VYALLHSSDRSQRLMSFGTVDSTSGKVSVISKWNSTSLEFVVGSLSAFDSESAQFYSRTLCYHLYLFIYIYLFVYYHFYQFVNFMLFCCAVVGSGGGPPVALVTVSAKSGEVENAVYFRNRAQPAGLFVF